MKEDRMPLVAIAVSRFTANARASRWVTVPILFQVLGGGGGNRTLVLTRAIIGLLVERHSPPKGKWEKPDCFPPLTKFISFNIPTPFLSLECLNKRHTPRIVFYHRAFLSCAVLLYTALASPLLD